MGKTLSYTNKVNVDTCVLAAIGCLLRRDHADIGESSSGARTNEQTLRDAAWAAIKSFLPIGGRVIGPRRRRRSGYTLDLSLAWYTL